MPRECARACSRRTCSTTGTSPNGSGPAGPNAASRSGGCSTTASTWCSVPDAPVSPLDPWLAIAAAVHRAVDGDEAWHPEQSITAREALAASTDGWGTVAVGHPADFVMLSVDPLEGDSDAAHASRLRAMGENVRGTRVAGNRIHG
ncbi:amidohydrolase family protein [Nocardioides sp. B-3]|uniref:amidohydrolase family protein n=1 Tax=Nocardioides sp. B-3 TaxID=2895565 RepID=UPI003FA532C9